MYSTFIEAKASVINYRDLIPDWILKKHTIMMFLEANVRQRKGKQIANCIHNVILALLLCFLQITYYIRKNMLIFGEIYLFSVEP